MQRISDCANFLPKQSRGPRVNGWKRNDWGFLPLNVVDLQKHRQSLHRHDQQIYPSISQDPTHLHFHPTNHLCDDCNNRQLDICPLGTTCFNPFLLFNS